MEEKECSYKLLVYGVEKRGLTAPSKPFVSRNFEISFAPFNTNHRFNEYDGVILFQGIFEHFESKPNYMDNYLVHSCYKNELDKRKKEAHLLLEKGGFLCFLLNKTFIDRDNDQDFRDSDLAKYYLNYSDLYRKNFSSRIAHLDIKSDDFKKFLSIYGAASSYFHHYNKYIDWRVLVKAGEETAGMTINRNQYFLPTLVPDNRADVVEEYFILLSEGLTSSNNKLQQTLPDWIGEFKFEEETQLGSEREALDSRIQEIDQRINVLLRYKSILILSGDDLVTNVSRVFSDGFGFEVDTLDELREDFKILDIGHMAHSTC